jgi:hypothetical protein
MAPVTLISESPAWPIRSTLLAFSQQVYCEGMALRLPLHFRRGMKKEDHMRDWQHGRGVRFVAVLSLWFLVGMAGVGKAEAGGVARVLPSGDGVQIEYQGVEVIQPDIIPLYRDGAARYFSAGIGLDERQADYPPFALKLVFTAGGKPYLTGVTVTIQGPKGMEKIVIPRERVTGPWLFVDVPAGTYDISAAQADQMQTLKAVRVERGKTKVVHLRWPEDRGIKLSSSIQ